MASGSKGNRRNGGSSCTQAFEDLTNALEPKGSGRRTKKALFMPRNELIRYLTIEKVKEILSCKCTRCRDDYDLLYGETGSQAYDYHVERIVSPSGKEHDQAAGALSLFGLLVYIHRPQFIKEFADRNMNDITSLDSFRDRLADENAEEAFLRELQENYWPRYREAFPGSSKDLAEKFRNHLPKFAVPSFLLDGKFVKYGPYVVLPFLNEQKIGEGSGGTVYEFKVHQHYGKDGQQIFARKQLFNMGGRKTALAFHLEQRNLESVRQLGHKNIVAILKSYRKGDELNIVFPRATTDLHECLRNESSNFGHILAGCPVESNPVWEQMIGVAEGLNAILTGATGEDDTPLYGYHFDLKPRNILVTWDGSRQPRLQITDFGMAWFKHADGSSRTKQPGGDEKYGAPEARLDIQNRQYDIWSLGCIMLEVVTFVVLSYDGVRKLDELCADGKAPCYYQVQDGSTTPNLKESIRKFSDDLRRTVALGETFTSKAELVVNAVLDVVMQMLEVKLEQRPNATEVVKRLQNAVAVPEAVTDKSYVHRTSIQPQDTEKEVGDSAISSLNRLWGLSNIPGEGASEPYAIQLRIFENDQHHLRFATMQKNLRALGPERSGLRSSIVLIPRYAMLQADRTRKAGSIIRLVYYANPHQAFIPYDIQGQPEDLETLQGTLLRQDVMYSVNRIAKIESHEPAIERVKNGLLEKMSSITSSSTDSNRIRAKSRITDNDSPYTVQLWRHADHEILWGKGQFDRINHIVIFCSKKIVLIPVKETMRFPTLTDTQRDDPQEKTLSLGPTESRKVRDSLMYVLHPRESTKKDTTMTALPGFPLEQRIFDRHIYHSEHEKTFSSIEFYFKEHDDMIRFYDTYRHLKREWQEVKRAQKKR